MLFSGSNFRSIAERNSLTWEGKFLVSGSDTGRAIFGFSGEGKTMNFLFESGKIFDPEERFFAGYSSNSFTPYISGNISGSKYDYHFNDAAYCLSGTKENFKPEKFFIDTTGCSLDTRVWIQGDPFNYELSFQTGFMASGSIVGFLKSTGVDASNKFKIFSGELLSQTGFFSISGFDAGNLTNNNIVINSSGTMGGTGIQPYVIYPIESRWYTSFGIVDDVTKFMPVEEDSLSVNLTLSDASNLNSTLSGANERSGLFNLGYEVAYARGNLLEGAADKPLYISLQYSGGKTGTFYQASGVNMITSGQDYSSIPTPLFYGRSHSKNSSHVDVSGIALCSFSLSGANMVHSGENYIANSNATISGGGGAGAVISGLTGDPTDADVAGKITGVKVINVGSGYSSAPTLIFSEGTGASAKIATGLANLKSGFITGVQLTNSGIYLGSQPYFSGFVGGSPSEFATAELVTHSYEKTFTGLWDLKTGYDTDSLYSYRDGNKISGHRKDDKVETYENIAYYWQGLRDICEKNEGTITYSYSFMLPGTMIYNTSTSTGPHGGPTGAPSLEIRDHYWSGYDDNPPANWERIGATQDEFTGQIGEAFREWKELIESAFDGVTVNFENKGFEGVDARGDLPSPFPYYRPLYDCDECGEPNITGYKFDGYYYYDLGYYGNNDNGWHNVGDFRIGVASIDTSSNVLAYAFLGQSYKNLLQTFQIGNHWGDLIFDAQDAWVVDDVDWKEKYGMSIKHVAAHEIGHALGLGHTSAEGLWPCESIMCPYGHVETSFTGNHVGGLKTSAIDKAAIKRLYSSGDYDNNWVGSGNGRQDNYSNLNNFYVNLDPTYITGDQFKIVVDYDSYNIIPVGFTSGNLFFTSGSNHSVFSGVGSTGLYDKYADVFGVPVIGSIKTKGEKVSAAASILAQYLDNDSDGIVDNPSVVKALKDNKCALIMTENEAEYKSSGSLFDTVWSSSGYNTQVIYSDINLESPTGGLKQIFHFVTSGGYANLDTGVFSLKSGSLIADLTDLARGGYFENVSADNTYSDGPSNGRYPSGAWFHSIDTGCSYSCQVNQYIWWGASTLMGLNENRCSTISGEWGHQDFTNQLCYKTGLYARDLALYDLLTNSDYRFPMFSGSGNYNGPTLHTRFENKFPDGESISAILSVTGRKNVSVSQDLTGMVGSDIAVSGLINELQSGGSGIPKPGGNFFGQLKRDKTCTREWKVYNMVLYTGQAQPNFYNQGEI